MNIERILFLVEELVFSKRGDRLSSLEKDILKGAYQGETYEQIAEGSGFSPIHIKMVGASLWEKLSGVFEEKIHKKNLRSFVERKLYRDKYTLEKVSHSELQTSLTAIDRPRLEENKVIIGKNILEDKIANLKFQPQAKQTDVTIVTELDLPSGPLDIESPFYIPLMKSESLCYQVIQKAGGLLRIKAPPKRGKTSLTLRIMQKAIERGYCTVYLNFQLADRQICQDLDRLLKWFCANVGQKLKLLDRIDNYWDDILGYKMSCNSYFEDYLLREIERPLVLVLDKVDYIFAYPEIAEDFFALLRAWYEEAKTIKVWKKLRLVLVYAGEVDLSLNIDRSPFNVGVSVELPEFLPSQVSELAARYQLNLSNAEIEQLTALVGGHPYLIQIALYNLARTKITVEQFLSLVTKEQNPYSKHLQKLLNNLQQQPDLAIALEIILKEKTEVSRLKYRDILKLNSMGLVSLKNNETKIGCELYRRFFSDRLQLI